MECNKVKEIAPGLVSFQKCDCTECEIKRSATQSFYERFDAVYKDYIGQVK